jgi:hypothetical protein
MRFQKNSRSSVDLMELILRVLETLVRGPSKQEIAYSLANY